MNLHEFAGNPNAVWIIWTIYDIFIEKIVNPHINFLTCRPRTVFQHHATFAIFCPERVAGVRSKGAEFPFLLIGSTSIIGVAT